MEAFSFLLVVINSKKSVWGITLRRWEGALQDMLWPFLYHHWRLWTCAKQIPSCKHCPEYPKQLIWVIQDIMALVAPCHFGWTLLSSSFTLWKTEAFCSSLETQISTPTSKTLQNLKRLKIITTLTETSRFHPSVLGWFLLAEPMQGKA